jgi:putative ABC transport system permease protein
MKKKSGKKAVKLPNIRFFSRFRLRIVIQNASSYIVLFFGILFVAIMMAMVVGMPETIDYYKENATDMMLSKYQYVMKEQTATENETAEPFCMTSLKLDGGAVSEDISVYGISADSSYAPKEIDSLAEDEVIISSSFGEKYGVSVGDTLTLNEKYENKQYTFKVAGFYDKTLSVTVYMPISRFRSVFDLKEDEISGYLSDTEITDIPSSDIAAVITERDITKVCDQLEYSMGSYVQYYQVLCVLLSAVMIYLLSKIIIEKNESAISMTKILGYENGEIARLYLSATAVMLILFDGVSIFLGGAVLGKVWANVMKGYSGWYAFRISPLGYVKMFVFILIGYLIVTVFDFRRIKNVPLGVALKNAE